MNDDAESQRARAFAHTVEILAVTGAWHAQAGQRDDWIRVWVAARAFLMKPSGPDAWAQALRERPRPV